MRKKTRALMVNNKISRENGKAFLIGGIIFVVLISWFGWIVFTRNNDLNDEIDNNYGETVGTVIDFHKGGKSVSMRIKVSFTVRGTLYESSFGCPDRTYFENQCFEQGFSHITRAKFVIEYSKLNPENCRIIVGKYKWLTSKWL